MRNFQYTIYDIESYNNYALVVAEHVEENRKMRINTRMTRREQMKKLVQYFDGRIMVGYNSSHYDSAMLEMWYTLLLEGYTNEEIEKTLKRASNLIVEEGMYSYYVFKKLKIENGRYFTHLDLAQGYLGIGTLKEVGIRLHHRLLEHTPVDFQADIEEKDIPKIIHYCDNDVDITHKLFDRKFNEVEAKQVLIEIFDLEDWTFAQTNRRIVEDILCGHSKSKGSEVCVYREPKFRDTGEQFHFNFKEESLQNVLEFYTGNVIPDKAKVSKIIKIGELDFEFRLGGLHGSKKKYVKSENKQLINADVTSYYPFMMKNFGFTPGSVKQPDAFYKMIDNRVLDKEMKRIADSVGDAKRSKYYKDLAWSKKIVINTVYGASKLNSSKLYDVQTAYSITITGQLLLAKLIENLNLNGYNVIYANTDGIIFEADKGDDNWRPICEHWERDTKLNLEYDMVNRFYLRDVNNYMIDFGTDEEPDIKSIGVYNLHALNKNEGHQRIVKTAIKENLFDGKEIEDVIYDCDEVTEFTMYQKYSKQYDPVVLEDLNGKREYLSNVVRYVYSKDERNVLKGRNTNREEESWTQRDADIKLVPDLEKITIDVVEKERYIADAYKELAKLLGDSTYEAGNPELVELRDQAIELGIDLESLTAGIDKKRLRSTYELDPWKDIRNNSVQVLAGPDTDILVLDIDDPGYKGAIELTKLIKTNGVENYAICYSEEYDLEQVLNNEVNFKVLFRYKGKRIPNKRTNNKIELFYNNTPVAILGSRGDGYNYKIEGTLNTIDFDVNDYLEKDVRFKFMERDSKTKK